MIFLNSQKTALSIIQFKFWAIWASRYRKLYAWKLEPLRENSWVSTREKLKSIREFFFESARENARVPVKVFKKVCVKNFFAREKNGKKAKKWFDAHFWFSTRKKNTAWLHPVVFLLTSFFVLVSACVCGRAGWAPKTHPGGMSNATWLSFWQTQELI